MTSTQPPAIREAVERLNLRQAARAKTLARLNAIHDRIRSTKACLERLRAEDQNANRAAILESLK